MNSTNFTISGGSETCDCRDGYVSIGFVERTIYIILVISLLCGPLAHYLWEYVTNIAITRILAILAEVPDSEKQLALRIIARRKLGIKDEAESKVLDEAEEQLKLAHKLNTATMKYTGCPYLRWCVFCGCEDCRMEQETKKNGKDVEK